MAAYTNSWSKSNQQSRTSEANEVFISGRYYDSAGINQCGSSNDERNVYDHQSTMSHCSHLLPYLMIRCAVGDWPSVIGDWCVECISTTTIEAMWHRSASMQEVRPDSQTWTHRIGTAVLSFPNVDHDTTAPHFAPAIMQCICATDAIQPLGQLHCVCVFECKLKINFLLNGH